MRVENSETAKAQFDKISNSYDIQRPKIIPRYGEFYGSAESAIAEWGEKTKAPRVADLGAGTGIMTERVLRVFPNARITLVDISDKMLALAKDKFNNNQNINFLLGDLLNYNTKNEKFDIIVSALAIHHISDSAKYSLYKKIYESLNSAGIFVNAEQILGETHKEEELFHMERMQLVEKIFGNDKSSIKIAEDRLKLDRCAKVSTQIEWMREIGFSQIENKYSYLDFAVFKAIK